ncbi:MAG: sulfurtransferase [Rickettsiales bacterium]|nr:sulfurtransferase [Rickettsiales bacterium]
MSANYAGDTLPKAAWEALSAAPKAQLVDVRTAPEWRFSGTPNLTSLGKSVHTISWRHWPDMGVNAGFVEHVTQQIPDTDAPIYLLCKTGGRSMEAAIALTQAGYTCCYNVQHGFEGDRNDQGQRGTVNGWKADALAWEQA